VSYSIPAGADTRKALGLRVDLGSFNRFLEHPATVETKDVKAISAIIGQCLVETGNMIPKSESLNYSSQVLWTQFSKYFSQADAERYGRTAGKRADQQGIANRMYGSRMGNEGRPNAGYIYRGRGFIQLTGYSNYALVGRLLDIPLLARPDLANDPTIAISVAWAMWYEMGLKTAYEKYGLIGLSRAVNLGNPRTTVRSLHEQDRIDYAIKVERLLSK
jgi:predicted chitinase